MILVFLYITDIKSILKNRHAGRRQRGAEGRGPLPGFSNMVQNTDIVDRGLI